MSLPALLAYADANAPALAIARSARARVEAARARADPLLPANPDVSVGVGPRIEAGEVGVDFEVGVSQRIEIAGERGLRADVATSFAELTEAQIESARWEIHADVHAAFSRALLERERVAYAKSTLTFQEELVAIVKRQAEAGEVAPLAQRLADAELAQARQVVVAAERSALMARIQLGTVSGWPVATPPVPVGVLPSPSPPPTLHELARRASSPHPSLRARGAAVREAQARAELAERERTPEPTLGANYTRESAPVGGDANHIVLGTVSIPVPLWQTNQADRAAAVADKLVAEAELAAARQLLGGRLVEAHGEVVAALERVESYGTEILPRVEEDLALLRRSYELGEIDLITLFAGRERFLRVQNDALSARIDYFLALANLERVVGAELDAQTAIPKGGTP